jgi:hypothetical protein
MVSQPNREALTMKARYLLVVLVAVLATASVVEAAPTAVQVAKNALKIGKSAQKTGKKALRTAGDARDLASEARVLGSNANALAKGADQKAGQALTAAGAAAGIAGNGPAVVSVKSPQTYASPLGFAQFNVGCPAGYAVSGSSFGNGALELVFEGSYGGGVLGSLTNLSSTTSYSGYLYVNCVKSSGATAAKATSRTELRKAMDRAQRSYGHGLSTQARASHSCGVGYTHASMSWGHKCLRAGQFCKTYKNSEYHRYGYHCKASGHLRRW